MMAIRPLVLGVAPGPAGGASVSAGNSSVSLSPSSIANDGSSSSTVTVTVKDTNNAVMSGVSVTLAATGTGNTVTQPSSVTNGSGVATGSIVSTVAESKTVSAVANGTTITQQPTLTVSAASGEPTPDDAGAGILYDIRASLDACTTRAQAVALIDDFDSGITTTEFNIYNDGSHVWWRYNYPTGGAGATEVAFSGVVPYVGTNTGIHKWCATWTHFVGKQSGDAGGQGTNNVLAFRTDYVNAHLKEMLFLRGTSGESVDRRLYTKLFPDDTDFQIDASGYSGPGWSTDVFDDQGTSVRYTIQIQDASSDGASDGVVTVWRNGTQIVAQTGQAIGRAGIWGLNTLATFISTTGPTTIYQRAIAIWSIP